MFALFSLTNPVENMKANYSQLKEDYLFSYRTDANIYKAHMAITYDELTSVSIWPLRE